MKNLALLTHAHSKLTIFALKSVFVSEITILTFLTFIKLSIADRICIYLFKRNDYFYSTRTDTILNLTFVLLQKISTFYSSKNPVKYVKTV